MPDWGLLGAGLGALFGGGGGSSIPGIPPELTNLYKWQLQQMQELQPYKEKYLSRALSEWEAPLTGYTPQEIESMMAQIRERGTKERKLGAERLSKAYGEMGAPSGALTKALGGLEEAGIAEEMGGRRELLLASEALKRTREGEKWSRMGGALGLIPQAGEVGAGLTSLYELGLQRWQAQQAAKQQQGAGLGSLLGGLLSFI
jgi:hypothetical protein